MSQHMLDAKNEIKRALAYKRLEEQRHRPYGKSSTPEEITKLYGESRFEELSEAILTTEARNALGQQCPECHRIFGEHSDEELIRCLHSEGHGATC
jgi:hypothetical protein